MERYIERGEMERDREKERESGRRPGHQQKLHTTEGNKMLHVI